MRGDELKVFALLAAMTADDREALAEILEERELLEGKSAFREGSEGEGLIFLARGALNLKSKRHGGFIGKLNAPTHLGTVSLFSLGKREVTAIAEDSCTIWLLPRAGLSRLASDAPHAAFRLAEAAVDELAGLIRPGIRALVEFDRN